MSKPEPRNVRTSMPELYAWLEGLREAFGRAGINDQLARALRGEATAYLSEGGSTIGTPLPEGVPLSHVGVAEVKRERR